MFCKRDNKDFLAVCLSFSAGVMLYISFVEIFAKARADLESIYGESTGMLLVTAAFFGGIAFIALIDKLIPQAEETEQNGKKHLRRMGIMTAAAIAVHNFPEGLITFMAALQDPALGITIAAAIAIHNIPEGIAIAVPIRYATGSRTKAVLASAASGLTEPMGAVAAYFLLLHWFGEAVFGFLFAAIGGIMVYISVKQLLPAAYRYGEHGNVMKGLFAGMAVMAVGLVVF